ncbi:SRPBCC family protein [Actinomadura sp. DC4]|uniref:SRPBCC family protein n=1 Tax=Actinomadura sp. DC4 TaxID=3055069 RepID=UPI0025B107A9|nr:SRPBCC family protein [Actinomadura sp. DC4]MDN3357142.1 SRPBCC family protein [Actinomadura sp. DC4]
MRYQIENDIDAAPEAVWAVLADVERWPEWTKSMISVRRLEDGPFGSGSKARVRQPRLPAATYTVTEYEPGRAFDWAAKSPGVTVTGGHYVDPRGDGRATVRLTVDLTGFLAPLVGLFTAKLVRHYIGLEAEGLKRRCEPTP